MLIEPQAALKTNLLDSLPPAWARPCRAPARPPGRTRAAHGLYPGGDQADAAS